MTFTEAFGKTIAKSRELKGYDIAKAAETTNLTEDRIREIEKGVGDIPNLLEIVALLETYDVTPGLIFDVANACYKKENAHGGEVNA